MGLTLDQIFQLSLRQQADIYGHETDDKGEIVPPPKGVHIQQDSKSRLMQLMALIDTGLVKATPEQIQELRRRASEGDPGPNPDVR